MTAPDGTSVRARPVRLDDRVGGRRGLTIGPTAAQPIQRDFLSPSVTKDALFAPFVTSHPFLARDDLANIAVDAL